MDEEQKQLAEELLFDKEYKPSFAKMLYLGICNSEEVFPFPQLSAKEKKTAPQLLKETKEFADNTLDPTTIDKDAKIPLEVIEGLAKLGILGMTIPKKYGGLGMSQYAYCQAVEEIGGRCGATAIFVNAHQSIGVKALQLFATEEQKNKWLPILAKGEKIAAFSLTEPNAGSDASGVETTANYDSEKKIFILNGKKQWTTNGSIASVLTVMAKTTEDTPNGKKEKITAFLVTPDMKGFNITNPGLEKLGIRGTRTTNLEFTNMEVPEENILGPKGKGLKVCLTCLDYGRTTFGAMCTGAAKKMEALVFEHAKNRQQFHRSLASFPLVKQKLSKIAGYVYAMDASTYLTAGLIDQGEEDIMLESAILKVFASDALWEIIYDSMQILGGKSFFTDQPYERMMRDARLNMIGEGSNEVMRAFIGAVGLRNIGMELESITKIFKQPITSLTSAKNFISRHCKQLISKPLPIKSEQLQKEAKRAGKITAKFGRYIPLILAKHGEDIIERQLTLDRLATIAINLYTVIASLSKLDEELQKNPWRKTNKELTNSTAVVKLYCEEAFQEIDQCLNTLFSNNDKEIEATSDQLTGVK